VAIAQDIFGQTDPEVAQSSTIVSVEARRLRRKLEDYYRTVGANDPIVIEIPKGTFVPVFQAISSPSETQSAPEIKKKPSRRFELSGRLIAILAIAFGLTFLSTWLWNTNMHTSGKEAFAQPVFTLPAIAVIPFRNSTGSPLNDGLAAGLTEDITTDLALLREINVISYSSASMLTNSSMTPAEIAETLNVSHVLLGNIRGTTPNIRISAELLDALTGTIIWAGRLDRELDDPLALQNEISSKVIVGLSVGLKTLKDRARRGERSVNPEASALFKQAMDLTNPPSDATRLIIAQLAFEAVIEADPSYSGGYAGVAYIRAFKSLWGHVPDPQAEAIASGTQAEKALDINPDSSLALDALALSKMILREFDAAVKLSEQAIEVAPNDPYAHSYHAFILTANGQSEAAIPFAEKAIHLDPLNSRTPYLNILGLVQLHAGDYAGALRSLSESERKGGPQAAGHIANNAAAYVGLGEVEKATGLVATLPPGFVDGIWMDWQKRSYRFSEDANRIPELLKQIN
jgi:adenylate cyclase